MSKYFSKLSCSRCGFEPVVSNLYHCPKCDAILETAFRYDEAFMQGLSAGRFEVTDILPCSKENYVYIGQGSTPLVEASTFSKELGFKLHLKCEHQNPTGSFKDRPVSCGVSMALDLGAERIVVASSGNGASAVSALCAKAKLPALIYVPESTPDEKVKQAVSYGGEVVRIEGPYSNSYAQALTFALENNAYNLTTTFINPYTIDGDKAVAYELFMKMGVPDAVFVPIGAGPLLVGILKGFEEIRAMGLCKSVPKMVGVQAQGCSPIYEAFLSKTCVASDKTPATIAGGICDGLVGYEQDGDYALAAIERSGGICVAVPDARISEYQAQLARKEGIFVEPSSAAGIAAVFSEAAKLIGTGGSAVAILTGHGLKDMKNAAIKS